LAGSERRLPANADDLGGCDPGEIFEVSVLLRRPAAAALEARLARLRRGVRDATLTREAFAAEFSAAPRDAAAVEAFAVRSGHDVTGVDLAARTVRLAGTAAAFGEAFGVDLRRMSQPSGEFRGRAGPVILPDDMVGVIQAVLGLDNRPQAKTHHRLFDPSIAHAATANAFTPLEVAARYAFPPGTGAGEAIAIIELGGGFSQADLTSYFASLGVSPPPKVAAVSVDGAANAPTGSADGPDGEVMLDIEIAGALAPAAAIVVYFAPNTDAGFLDAVTAAIHDTTWRPSVISISWGGPESAWTSQAMTALDEAIAAAATMGVTVCVACGDNGSNDGVSDGADHVDFPASSPHALACGGTTLASQETVWNDGAAGGATGGGVSAHFALPTWQAGLAATRSAGGPTPLTKRGLPDVCGDADPQTGFSVRVDGQDLVIGGTSAVAPLWVGLIARINGNLKTPAGLIAPALYAHPAAFNDITSGNNGDFTAAKGWDACTGLGSPKGGDIQSALQAPAPGS
jgi:kumamolisin